MRIFIFLLIHVFADLISTPELLVVETDDGVVYGIDSALGTSVWSIITGPALIASTSHIENADFHITEEGHIYVINYSAGTSFKLPQSIYEILEKGPLTFEEIPKILMYANKNTKLFRVNVCNGEYSEEVLIGDLCPVDDLTYKKSLMFGRIDYSLFGINEATSELVLNLTFSKFTSFSGRSGLNYPEIDSISVLEDDNLVLKSGENTLWTKKFANSIIGMHGYVPGKFTLDRVDLKYSYFMENSQSHYSDFILIGLLLVVAMSIGFYFGRRYVAKRQNRIEEIAIRIPTPIHSRHNSEAAKFEELSLVKQEPTRGIIYEFMNNKALNMDSFIEDSMLMQKIIPKNVGVEKGSSAVLEYSCVTKDNQVIKSEVHKIVTAYELPDNHDDSSSMFNAVVTRENMKTEYKINSYPAGEFSKVIEVLDDGNYNKKFMFERILGYGGFSEVHLARHKLDEQLYAIKIVEMKIGEKEHLTSHKLFSEVNAIKTLQSKYVVRYITCWVEVKNSDSIMQIKEESSFESSEDWQSSDRSAILPENYMTVFLHIQMEYCEGMSLKEWFDNENRIIDRKKNYVFFYQILKGIQHIHERGIIHRDLKPANIFIDGEENIKIGDFNLATFLFSSSSFTNSSSRQLHFQRRSKNIGTPLYLAPEQETTDYNHKVDIFPLGLVLLQMCFKSSTYHELSRMLGDIRKKHCVPAEVLQKFPVESEIVLQMTEADPEKRPDAGDILKGDLMERWKKEVV